MKYLRKTNGAKLYTCFACYKSWLNSREGLTATRLKTK